MKYCLASHLALHLVQAAMSRLQDDQASWAMTRLGVVEMVVQRIDEMLQEMEQRDAAEAQPS